MSVSAEIYWATELSVEAAGRTLAERLKDCHLRYATDEPSALLVYRQAPDSPEWIGGEISTNYLASVPLPGESVDDPEWQGAMDNYSILWSLYRYPKDEQAIRREAEQLFEDLAEVVPDPLLLTWDANLLLMGRLPGAPITRFPEGTGTGVEARPVWLRFRLDPPA